MFSFNYKALLLGSAAAALVVGCGDSGDLSDNAVSAECSRLFRCAGQDSDTGGVRAEYGTEANCVDAESDRFDAVDEYRQYIEAGTVVIDQGAADRCLAALRATCTNTVTATRACGGIFVGQVADGGGCSVDVECASGMCEANGFEECGSCMALIPQGGQCDFFLRNGCAPGPNGEPGFCNAGTGTCSVVDEEDLLTADAAIGTDCDYEQLCEAGLYCQNGTCARWRELGDSCDPDSDSCGRGTFCLEDEADPGEGTCVRVRIESSAGEDCGTLDDELVNCSLEAGLYCNDEPTGVCALFVGDGEEGDYCEETRECEEGLTCLYDLCTGEPLVDGSECSYDGQCASGNCVERFDPYARACEPPLVCP